MRQHVVRASLLTVTLCVLLPLTLAVRAYAGGNIESITPDGTLTNGTPTAIVVSSPSGNIGSWSSRSSGPKWQCHYLAVKEGFGDKASRGIDYKSGPVTPEVGSAYYLTCRDESGSVAYSALTVFDPADPLGGVAPAQRAAEMAFQQLTLDLPSVGLSPPVGSDQIVGVPMWLWVSNLWTTTSASATLGAVTATVTATPRSVTHNTGDGSTVTCSTGVAYDTTKSPRQQQTNCSHTYINPGNYTVRSTITWDVNWTATTGAGDSLGTTTRVSDTPVHVVEIQAQIR